MALSMDEQRMLAEIERRLAAEDPGLAARLSAFRRPSRVSILRSGRARVIGSLLTVAVVAMVSLMVYAILPFRSGSRTPGHAVTISSTGTGQPEISAGPAPAESAAALAAAKSAAARAASGGSVRQSSSSGNSGNSSASSAAVHQADGSP